MKIRNLISFLIIGLVSTACGPTHTVPYAQAGVDPTTDACHVTSAACETLTPDSGDLAQARMALLAFFDALNAGQYQKAVELYGGSYEELIADNPDVDPDDHVTLLERACSQNGFQCLQVKEILREEQAWPDDFTFTIEFLNRDGSLFLLGSCCGVTEADQQPQSQFGYTVKRIPQAGNVFRVQELPVYVP